MLRGARVEDADAVAVIGDGRKGRGNRAGLAKLELGFFREVWEVALGLLLPVGELRGVLWVEDGVVEAILQTEECSASRARS